MLLVVELLMDKTLVVARNLISNMASNTQQFGVKGSIASKVVNELVIGQHHISPLVRVCVICAFVEHPTNACPTLQEIELNSAEVATMMGGQQYRQPHDQYPNLRYGSNPMQQVPQRYQPPPPFKQQQAMQPQNPTKTIPLPFPSKAIQERKFEIDDELLQTFNKVEINIPLLDDIR
ncbi:hypothetical protein CR513_42515, partial [Mucuna pruriens]